MRVRLISGVLLLCAARAGAQAAPPTVANAVMLAEQQWNDAWLARDLNKVKAIIADDYVGANDDGVFVSKQDHVDGFAGSGGEVFKVLRVHDMKVRLYGDIAVNVGELHMELTHNGKPTGGDFLFTDVWELRNGTWQVVASAETPSKADQDKNKGKPPLVGPEEFKPAAVVFRRLPKPSAEIERQIVDAERALDVAFIRKDSASMARLIAVREYSDVWDDGFSHDFAQDAADLRSKNTTEFITPVSYVVRQHGDIAIYMATIHQAGMYLGEHFEENLNTMDVWHRQAGIWKCVATHSVSSAKQPDHGR
jgi:ketosteroid isomerase-like protein